MAGATPVTVVPLVTMVVGWSVVVTGAADVSGVLGGIESVGDDDAPEVGMPDGVVAAGAPAPVVVEVLVAVVGGSVGLGNGVAAPDVAAGAVMSAAVEVSTGGASTVAAVDVVVEGATAGVDCGAVRVGGCPGGGPSAAAPGSRVWAGGGAGAEAEAEAGGACGVDASAGGCCRSAGPPPAGAGAGAGATVVVVSSGTACDTGALRRALGAMAANAATVAMIFFT